MEVQDFKFALPKSRTISLWVKCGSETVWAETQTKILFTQNNMCFSNTESTKWPMEVHRAYFNTDPKTVSGEYGYNEISVDLDGFVCIGYVNEHNGWEIILPNAFVEFMRKALSQ